MISTILDLDAKMQKHDFLKQNTNELGRGIFLNPDLDLLASSLDLTLTCYPPSLGLYFDLHIDSNILSLLVLIIRSRALPLCVLI